MFALLVLLSGERGARAQIHEAFEQNYMQRPHWQITKEDQRDDEQCDQTGFERQVKSNRANQI